MLLNYPTKIAIWSVKNNQAITIIKNKIASETWKTHPERHQMHSKPIGRMKAEIEKFWMLRTFKIQS